MSCLTMAFQAVKRSMRTSDGRRSCGAVAFWTSDWARDLVERWLVRETDVARESEAPSFMAAVGGGDEEEWAQGDESI
jgi:hypothetical protein